nr:hypothetical protein [Acidobacteriota bacterium]
MAVRELVGVYDADATLWGEVSYWVGARLGQRHCSLCDITHGLFTAKPQWRECAEELPVPFTSFHRNDQPEDVRACIGDRLPAVVARTESGVVMFVTSAELDSCHGSPEALAALLTSRLETH